MTSPENKTQVLPANDVLKKYAAYLESKSWCIDSSGAFSMALHSSSGRQANLDHFRNIFPVWSKEYGIRVQSGAAGEYGKFLDSLRTRLPMKLPSILGSTMRPTSSPFITVNGAIFANTYSPFKPERPLDYSAPPLAEELLDRLFPDHSERKWCLQFLAHGIQKPLIRPQHSLLITGKGSTCKSSLMRLVRAALGGDKHFYSKGEYTQALQKFSEVIPDNLFVVFDDATASKGTYEDLKDIITCERQTIEIKGNQNLVTREVFARIVIISNSVRPLRLVDDRRFFAPTFCQHLVDEDESKAFGKRVSDWLLEPGTPAILYHWLMSVDLTGFTVGSCPRTETLTQMEGASTPALERHIRSFIEEKTVDNKLPIFHEREIAIYLFNAGLQRLSTDEIEYKLIAQGYVHKEQRHLSDTKKNSSVEKVRQIFLWKPLLQKGERTRDLTHSEKTEIKLYIGN